MAVQDVLDLARVHVHAVADHHVRNAVGDEQVAVLVDAPDVAHGERAVAPRRRRLVVIAVVVERGTTCGLDVDDAFLARRQRTSVAVDDTYLDPRPRQPDGPGPLQPFRWTHARRATFA